MLETTGFKKVNRVQSMKVLFATSVIAAGLHSHALDSSFFDAVNSERVTSSSEVKWQQFGPGMCGNNYHIYWHPTDPRTVFLGPNMGLAYRSTNKGNTYHSVLDYDGRGYRFNERGPIEITSPDFSHQNAHFGFCSKEKGEFLYKTTNKGKTWEPHIVEGATASDNWNGNYINTVEVDPSDENVWYIGSGTNADANNYLYTKAKPHGFNKGFDDPQAVAIFKSTNKGRTWKDITPRGINADAQITRIFVHPDKSNVVFAGTTYGFYKSIDGGENWVKRNSDFDTKVIRSMDMHYDKDSKKVTLYAIDLVTWKVDPTNSKRIINGGGGVFRSDDEGANWRKISDGMNLNVKKLSDVWDIKKSYFSLALNNWFGIDDAETKYNVLPTELLHSVSLVRVDPNNKEKVFVLNNYKSQFTFKGGMMWRTDNGGDKWFVSFRSGTAWNNEHKQYWKNRGNPRKINITLRSQLKWAERDKYDRKAGAALEFNADSSRIMFQVAKILCISKDGGDTWVENDEVDASAGDEHWVGAGNSNLPGHGVLFNPHKPEKVYLPAGENDYWITTGDGHTVREGAQAVKRISLGEHEYSCSTLAFHPKKSNIIYSLQFRQASSGKLLKSVDSGATFEEYGDAVEFPDTPDPIIHQLCLTIDPVTPKNMYFCIPKTAKQLGYVGDSEGEEWGVRKSINGGQTWAWANEGLPGSHNVASIVMDPNNNKTLYAGVMGFTGGLYVSYDKAETWEKHDTFPTVRGVQDVYFAPDGKLYVSCGSATNTNYSKGGVFVSDDSGISWKQIFSSAWARMARVAKYDSDVILVQMNSQNEIPIENPGTYLSKNGGDTWKKINTGNPQSDRVNEIGIDTIKEDTYYLSTYGCGWYKGTP